MMRFFITSFLACAASSSALAFQADVQQRQKLNWKIADDAGHARKKDLKSRHKVKYNGGMQRANVRPGESLRSQAALRFAAAVGESTFADVMDHVYIEAMSRVYICCCGLACILALVTTIYWNRGIFVCGTIFAYIAALSLMSVLIRRIYTQFSFDYPQFVTATHFLCTSLTGFLLLCRRKVADGTPIEVPPFSTFAYGIVPVALTNAFSIGFANRGLLYCNAHFYEMSSSMTLLVTAAVGSLMGKPLHRRLIVPLLLITVGIFVVSTGEINFSGIGLMFIVFAIFLRALKVQLQGLLLGGGAVVRKLDPIEVVAWSGLSCFLIMTGWSAVSEGAAPLSAIWKPGTCQAVLVSAVAACVLNTTALFVLKELGPVAQQCVGQLKGAAATVIAVVALGEVVSAQQVVGYAVVIASVFWFNTVDKAIKNAEPKVP